MQVTRQRVVDILRTARLPELAEEADRVLPDPVEYNDTARFLFQYGITKDDLISRIWDGQRWRIPVSGPAKMASSA